jgi:hypothetical protein
MLADLLGGFIVIVIGANLIGPVANGVYMAQTGNGSATGVSNVTGASGTILGLTTLFFALGIMTAGVALAVGGLRNAGMV